MFKVAKIIIAITVIHVKITNNHFQYKIFCTKNAQMLMSVRFALFIRYLIEKSKSKPSAGSYISISIEVHYITIYLHIIRPFEAKIKF